jgi:hypothetical protein
VIDEDVGDLLFAWNFDPSSDGVRGLGAGDGATKWNGSR